MFLNTDKNYKTRPFKLTDIEYDQIKDEIARMEHVEYNTSVGRKFMNADGTEYFANFWRP